ncbi:MAG: Outer membrane protein chaperone/metalloprotease BepA/YfgC [Candidatus Alkanophagales archaeon MCA70_species_1]|nr:Outer membrane protein chaperone/metalloprotease BepA/YfgC [Candidatus Alkanophaga volatiphilum]
MDRLTAALVTATVAVAGVATFIVYRFGWLFLLRLILGLGFAGLAIVFATLLVLLAYARSPLYAMLSFLGLLSSAYAAYQCYTWAAPLHVVYIVVAYIAAAAAGFWYISEPALSPLERVRSARSLEKAGNYKAAARKYERRGDYTRAAEYYERAGMPESAAWCYERAGELRRAAELHEKIAEGKKDSYHWREAYELWKKAGEKKRAADCLCRYAESEPWYWDDVAKLYEEVGDEEKAKMAWQHALDYYVKEAAEEGVFWEDVANIYEKLGKTEDARDALEKYAVYCEKEAEKDASWWRYAAEAYGKLGMKEKADEATRRYEEWKKRRKAER